MELRKKLLAELNFTLVRVFDTNEHEQEKDVCLVKDSAGQELVLRVCERRPINIYPSGFHGKHIVFPKLVQTSIKPCYEIEEYIPGTMVEDADAGTTKEHIIRPDILTRLFSAFWEFQEIFASVSLEPKPSKYEKHLIPALTLLDKTRKTVVNDMVREHLSFFQDTSYPSKWKFSDDNLILMDDGRVGLVDNANIGLRFWGYDIGWLYWSRWFRLTIHEWQNTEVHIKLLENFFEAWWQSRPSSLSLTHDKFMLRAHLGLLTRLIGTLYDIAENISHTKCIDTKEKRDAFISFIITILDWNIGAITTVNNNTVIPHLSSPYRGGK